MNGKPGTFSHYIDNNIYNHIKNVHLYDYRRTNICIEYYQYTRIYVDLLRFCRIDLVRLIFSVGTALLMVWRKIQSFVASDFAVCGIGRNMEMIRWCARAVFFLREQMFRTLFFKYWYPTFGFASLPINFTLALHRDFAPRSTAIVNHIASGIFTIFP